MYVCADLNTLPLPPLTTTKETKSLLYCFNITTLSCLEGIDSGANNMDAFDTFMMESVDMQQTVYCKEREG